MGNGKSAPAVRRGLIQSFGAAATRGGRSAKQPLGALIWCCWALSGWLLCSGVGQREHFRWNVLPRTGSLLSVGKWLLEQNSHCHMGLFALQQSVPLSLPVGGGGGIVQNPLIFRRGTIMVILCSQEGKELPSTTKCLHWLPRFLLISSVGNE